MTQAEQFAARFPGQQHTPIIHEVGERWGTTLMCALIAAGTVESPTKDGWLNTFPDGSAIFSRWGEWGVYVPPQS